MNNILISIIVPCYNQGQFLNEALQSIFDQTYPNWECIIVNDGSTDNTEEIVNEWVAKDSRFNYYKKANSGVSATRNFGLEKVKGQFIQFLDADDILDKSKLEISLNELHSSNDNNIKVVISNFRMLSLNSQITTDPYCRLNEELFNLDNLLYKWQDTFSIPIHCGFFDASLFETVRFPTDVTAQEDWIVWVKIFKTGCKATFIDEPLAFYRINPNSRTMSKSLLEDQIKAFEIFKTILTETEFHRFSIVLIARYYKAQEELKKRIRVLKNSNSFQTGLLVKKILKTIGVLKAAKLLFPKILKFKSK